jgi:hypothetical protein
MQNVRLAKICSPHCLIDTDYGAANQVNCAEYSYASDCRQDRFSGLIDTTLEALHPPLRKINASGEQSQRSPESDRPVAGYLLRRHRSLLVSDARLHS